jgi:hypothetical protein
MTADDTVTRSQQDRLLIDDERKADENHVTKEGKKKEKKSG